MLTPHSRATLKLVCFAVLSLLIHVLLVFGTAVPLPQLTAEPPPLTARLQPSEPPPVSRPAVVSSKRRPRVRHAAPPAPASSPAPQPPPAMTAVTASAPPEPSTEESAALPETEIPVDDGQPASADPETLPETADAEVPAAISPPAEAAAPEPAPPAPTASIERRLPHKGEISYVLYLGANKFNVGRTRQTWEIQDDNYRLSSISETTGLVALFANQRLIYESRGRLTANGLRPDNFTTQRTRSGRREDAGADFDWSAMTATIGNPQHSVSLPAQTQDIISFMYQLGLMSLTPGRIELPVTNGWKLERYQLDIGAEEQLQTPLGALLAFPVTQVRRPGQESIELWLAPAYRLLPVRIRFFDKQGEPSGEQVVANINVSND